MNCLLRLKTYAWYALFLFAAGLLIVRAQAAQVPEVWLELAKAHLAGQQVNPKAIITILPPDNPIEMPACHTLEAFSPVGSKIQGMTSVGIRCLAPKQWSIFMRARVEVIGPYLVTHTAVAAGHLIEEADIDTKEGDLMTLPPNAITDKKELLGRTVTVSQPLGQIWRRDLIKVNYVVQSGQAVQLKLEGNGFQVTGDGVAISNGAEGQTVQVRTGRGGVLSGVAHAGGWVELHL